MKLQPKCGLDIPNIYRAVLRKLPFEIIQFQPRTNMGPKKDLTEEENSVIIALVDEKRSVRNIDSRVKRCNSAVQKVILSRNLSIVEHSSERKQK